MADELKLFGNVNTQSGLTVTAKVYNDLGVQQGSDVSCTEVGSTAIYLGDAPQLSAGRYVIRFFAGGSQIGQGEFKWDGTQEIIDGLTSIDGISEYEVQRIILSALAGKVNGAGTHRMAFRDVQDTKDRIVASVDTDGNRKAVTLDGS